MSDSGDPADLLSSQALLRDTTRSVLRTIEWAALCYQTSTLIWSVTFDQYPPVGLAVMALLIPAHVALLPAYLRGRGPFSRGGVWVPIAIAASLGVQGLVAMLSPRNTFGTPWILMSNYLAGTFALLAFYPWARARSARSRAVIDSFAFVFLFGYFILLTAINNDAISWVQVKSAAVAMLWPGVGYVVGKAVAQVSIVATSRQLEAQQRSFNEFFDFLHSDVKAGIAATKIGLSTSDVDARRSLRELESAVSDYRVRLALALEQVPVAALFNERIRAFAGVVAGLRSPRVGALTVPRPIGVVLNRAVGDLLTNAVVHGASTVTLGFDYDRLGVVLRVIDDGPGFAGSVLDDEATSLHRLRQAARTLGGELKMTAAQPRGTVMQLSIPYKGVS